MTGYHSKRQSTGKTAVLAASLAITSAAYRESAGDFMVEAIRNGRFK